MTDAEVDHTAGLMLMRESDTVTFRSTESVFNHLKDGRGLVSSLGKFTDLNWIPLTETDSATLNYSDYVKIKPLPLTGHPPLDSPHPARSDDTIGLVLKNTETDTSLIYLPCLPELTDEILSRIEESDLALVDGTFWTSEELFEYRDIDRDAFEMGHVPMAGSQGSYRQLGRFDTQVVYVHINNTNPVLDPQSDARREIEDAGLQVGEDGMEFRI